MERKKEITKDDEYIRWFSEISNKDIGVAGGKGASLGEMYNFQFPVPPGFVITAQAFDYFLNKHRLKDKIKTIIETIDMEDIEELNRRSREIRKLIESQEMPKELETEILESYHILSSEKIDKLKISEDALNILKTSHEPLFVSVRSSATTEDLADASFAGQQESFLNIKGDKNLINYIKKCFSSLYTPRAIYYRNKKGFNQEESLLAVVIQKMVDSEKSGVVFSKDPTNQSDNIIVEAVYGLGEGIVSGKIKPDNYIVSRDLEIQSIKIVEKKIAIVRTGSGENEIVKLTSEKSKSQVLNNSKIIEISDYALKLEEHYKKPQDIEFAIEAEKVYIVQSRPVTTLKEIKKSEGTLSGNVILSGSGASPGIGVGVVKVVYTMQDLSKIKKGDVLVTEMTNPDMVVSMQKAVAIVTDEGGMTSHAAIISREMGIPCVTGTEEATKILKDGMKITVDGTTGKIYEGQISETRFAEIKKALETNRIRLKVILDLPDFAERAAESGINSVGLLRLEGIIASSGKHPVLFEKNNRLDEYSKILIEGIEKIARYFNSLWIRTSDIRTDEFSSLKGAPEKELNPMLGFHGIRFSLKHPKIFEAELYSIKKVAEKYPNKKFGVMFPQIISIEEVIEAKEFFNKFKRENIVLGVMIETPSAVQIIEDICKEGISFISFGTNDLTQFTLAVDRGNEDVQYLYNELHPAVFSQIKKVIGTCRRYKVETSICGQAGSNKDMVEFLFRKGINSISVNADSAYNISKLIKELEEQRTSYLENKINGIKNDNQNRNQDDNYEEKMNEKEMNKEQIKENGETDEINKSEKNNEDKEDDERILNHENIKIKAVSEQDDLIENIDNLGSIKKETEEIKKQIKENNIEKIEQGNEIEEDIKFEEEAENKQSDDEQNSSENNDENFREYDSKEKIGVYMPDKPFEKKQDFNCYDFYDEYN